MVSILSLIFALMLPLSFDEVVLKNGHTLEGEVIQENEKHVVLRIDFGTMRIARGQVDKIIYSESALQKFETKKSQVQVDDVTALYELAQWAKTHDLLTHARDMCREILSLDPDHAGAREVLGYRKLDDRWVTEKEYWTSKGFVQFQGEWVPKDVAMAREKEFEKTRRQRQENEAQERIRTLEGEIAEKRLEVEKMRAENEEKPRRTIYAYPLHYHRVGPAKIPCRCPNQKK